MAQRLYCPSSVDNYAGIVVVAGWHELIVYVDVVGSVVDLDVVAIADDEGAVGILVVDIVTSGISIEWENVVASLGSPPTL